MKFKTCFFLILFPMFGIFKSTAQDWPDLDKYGTANARIDTTHSKENRVIFMGNSITEGWVREDPDFFNENNYIGRGISGQTTPQMLLRFRQDVIELDPEMVVILAGTNDIAGNTGPTTLDAIFNNIESMVELAHANSIKVVIVSVLPAFNYPWRPEVKPVEPIRQLNVLLKTYCEQKDVVYLNLFEAMKNPENGLDAAYTNDGVHPTLAGYQVMAPMTIAAIKEARNK